MVTTTTLIGITEGVSGSNITIETETPIECPSCHKGIEPMLISHSTQGGISQVFMRCPLCKNSFVGKFIISQNIFYFKEFYDYKKPKPKKDFSDGIEKLSKDFILIYAESEIAEENKLNQICGAGYRKAFEFLIKDYLISRLDSEAEDYSQEKEKIIKKSLGDCISQNITDIRIQQMAERATWLGNDETHYYRKWEDKDLSDLKKLIDIVMHFIDMEILSNSYTEEMKKNP